MTRYLPFLKSKENFIEVGRDNDLYDLLHEFKNVREQINGGGL